MKKRGFAVLILMILLLSGLTNGSAQSGGFLENGADYRFQAIGVAAHLPTVGQYRILQGGGSDGKYANYAMIDNISDAINTVNL